MVASRWPSTRSLAHPWCPAVLAAVLKREKLKREKLKRENLKRENLRRGAEEDKSI